MLRTKIIAIFMLMGAAIWLPAGVLTTLVSFKMNIPPDSKELAREIYMSYILSLLRAGFAWSVFGAVAGTLVHWWFSTRPTEQYFINVHIENEHINMAESSTVLFSLFISFAGGFFLATYLPRLIFFPPEVHIRCTKTGILAGTLSTGLWSVLIFKFSQPFVERCSGFMPLRTVNRRDICFGLMRFFGFAAFLVPLIIVHFKWKGWFGVDIRTAFMNWGWGTKILFAAAMLVISLFLLFIGQGIGSLIRIKSDRISRFFDIVWHYGANGAMVWALMMMIILNIYFGKDVTKSILSDEGSALIGMFFFTGLLAGWSIAFSIYVISDMAIKLVYHLGTFLSRMLPISICVFLGYSTAVFFNAAKPLFLAAGFLSTFLIIYLSLDTLKKDEYLRTGEI